MKTNFYLARHGQTQWNKEQRFQGQFDSELTQTGKQQSVEIAQHLVNKEIDLIISSTLGRAFSSAVICQKILNTPMYSLDTLAERNLGHWQGMFVNQVLVDDNYNELLRQYTSLKPEGGESAIDCGARIHKALQGLVINHLEKNLLVIFHGEALRCFLAKLGRQSKNNAYELFENGCILHLSYDHDDESFQIEH